ncbi:MAG: hypothetical protein K6A63_05710 [Acholeplasmatales bacterium]|nr:hypothetical protein [Acholeplasmatales bacterium]
MRKIVKWILTGILIFIFFILFSFGIDSAVEHVILSSKISAFKKKAVYQEDISSYYVKYYKIDLDDQVPGYTMYEDRMLPGSIGDIITSPDSNFFQNMFFGEMICDFMGYFVGGHAAIVLDSYQDYEINVTADDTVESTVTSGNSPAFIVNRDYWNSTDYFTEVIGYRAPLTDTELDDLLSVAVGQEGDFYNSTFTFNTKNKSYCSDLITKVYKRYGINTNKDGYWTTVWDIMTTPDLDIVYYHKVIGDIKYIYYVE